MSRAIVETDDITHENVLSLAVWNLVYLLTTGRLCVEHYTRYSMRKDLISLGYRGWAVLKVGAEVLSVVDLGPAPYTLLARLSVGL